MASNDNIITNFSNATVIDGTLKVSNNILFTDRKQLSEGVYSVMNQVAPIVSSVGEKSGYVAVANNDNYDIFHNGSKVKQVKPVSMKVDDIAGKLLEQYSQYGGNLDVFSNAFTKDVKVTASETDALSLSDTDWNKQQGGANMDKMTSTPNTDMELLNNLNKALVASAQSDSDMSFTSRDTAKTPQTADLLDKLPAMLKQETAASSSAMLLTDTESFKSTQKGGAYKDMKMDSQTPETDMDGLKKMMGLADRHNAKNVVSSVSSMSLGAQTQTGGNMNPALMMNPYGMSASMMQTPQTADLLNNLPNMVQGMNPSGMSSTEMMFSEAMSANSTGSVRSNYVDIVLDQ